MAETLKSIASATSKLRALLQDTKKDLHRIQILQTELSDALHSLWPGDEPSGELRDVNTNAARGDSQNVVQVIQQPLLWKETLALVASGRIVGVAAQADHAFAHDGSIHENTWVGDGKRYTTWLGRGVVYLSGDISDNYEGTQNLREQCLQAAAQLFGKSLGIGYSDDLVQNVTKSMVVSGNSQPSRYYELVACLQKWEQRHFLTSLIRYLDNLLNNLGHRQRTNRETSDEKATAAIAGFLSDLIARDSTAQYFLSELLITQPIETLLVRAIVVALPDATKAEVLQKLWSQFGDPLYIKRRAIAQQDTHLRILLILAGYVHRSDPMEVLMLARSGEHGKAISERLKNSSVRIRWLGMVFGTTISGLVDKQGLRLTFEGVDGLDSAESSWYKSLVTVKDEIGPVTDMRSIWGDGSSRAITIKPKMIQPTSKIEKIEKPKIQVVEDSSDDDDLMRYAKPDSDPDDSEDDATLVQRDKPKAPVYIRTLISGLQDSENHDRHVLALSTAASLIRRKADFGSELSDRCEELASTLTGLNDHFDIENWHQLRERALIALLLAQPKTIGPAFAKMLFVGDYSIAQRAAILTALGLGARQMAGFGDDDTDTKDSSDFPSKQLPQRLHDVYTESQKVDAISKKLEQTMLRPVSTKQRPRKKILKNELAGMVAESIFFPLTGFWQSHVQSRRSTSRNAIIEEPTLTAHFFKTLAIIVSAAGPSFIQLPQITTEFWRLLLSIRSRALHDAPVLEAVLFGFLAILEVNEDQRNVATKNSTELVETREWVGTVYEKLEAEGGSSLVVPTQSEERFGMKSTDKEGERCKVIAAGVLVKISEIVEKYQRLLVGDLFRVAGDS